MKKKLIFLGLLMSLFFAFTSCDILSTLVAAKGFYDEYQEYSVIYENATQMTILTETQLTISDDTILEGVDEIDSRVYVILDKESDFLYVEQTIFDDSKTSVYEDADNLYVEYIIDAENLVTPTKPAEEDRFDTNMNANIMNDSFSYDSVSNENKVGEVYSFDVNLTQAINLDALSDFVDQLAIFGGDETSFNDAVAHVEIQFTDTDSEIDVNVTLSDYTIALNDDATVMVSLTNHTVLKVPANFEMPNVFGSDYKYLAPETTELARRPYLADELINYPLTASVNGYNLLTLEAGEYEIQSTANMSSFTYELYDANENLYTVVDNKFTVTEAGNFYLLLMPSATFDSDITVVDLNPEPVTEATTTEAPTTTTTAE